ncbi:MAG: fibronectin type III domain-containing protein, partial [Myxococcales bacterium]|nr:fibronectin type III domain-containing protein [Myxococcales bacterium]
QCDYGLFDDTGCRPGYECRTVNRFQDSNTSRDVCLPINWWRDPSRGLDYGVTVGEMTSTTAQVWTHTGQTESSIEVHYGTSRENLNQTAFGQSFASDGYTAQIPLSGLEPGTHYYYEVDLDDGLARSEIGQFRTAPTPGAAEGFTFLVSGDIMNRGSSLFDLFNLMAVEDADFYISMGDWPYADAAATLSGYWSIHKLVRDDPQIRNFIRSMGMFAIFDDHEVYNDWDAAFAASNPSRVQYGLAAWEDWFPFEEQFDGEYYRHVV